MTARNMEHYEPESLGVPGARRAQFTGALDADRTEAAEAPAAQQTESGHAFARDQASDRTPDRTPDRTRTGATASVQQAQTTEATAYLLEAMQLRPLTGSRADALKAVRLLERAAALDPGASKPLYLCGVIHHKFGLHAKATDYFEQALERNPRDPGSLIELGWVWLRTGEFERARTIAVTAPPPVNEKMSASDTDDPSLFWRWRRFKAAVLLEEKLPLAALDAYPAPPPTHAPVDLWWREFLHIAQVAGAHSPAAALERLEAIYEQLPDTWERTAPSKHSVTGAVGDVADGAAAEANERRQYDDGVQQLAALMGNLAVVAADFERAQHYWDSVRPTSAAYFTVQRGLRALLDNKALAAYEDGDLDTAVSLWREAVAAAREAAAGGAAGVAATSVAAGGGQTSAAAATDESRAPGARVRGRGAGRGSVGRSGGTGADTPAARLVHALTTQGIRHWEEGKHAAAIERWEEVRRLDPEFIPAAFNLAVAHEHVGRRHDANQYWEAYIRLAATSGRARDKGVPGMHSLLLRMAANAVHANDGERTRQLLQRADGLLPARSDQSGNDALEASTDGRSASDGADTLTFDPAIAADPVAAANTMTYIGLLHTSVGDGRRALAAFERALSIKPDLEPALQGVMHAASLDDIDPLHSLALIRSVSEQFPDGSRVIHYWRSQMLSLVKTAWERGNYDEAMRLCTELLLSNGEDVDAWLWAGALHQKNGNDGGAQDCFAEAIRIDPERAQTHIDLGAHMLAAGDREAAEQNFTQAVTALPTPHTHVSIGELCAQIGVPDLAEHHFRTALESVKEDAEPFLARAVCGLIQTGYEDRVHTFLETAYKQVPNNVYIRILLALQHMRAEQWPDADAALRAAQQLATQPEDASLHEHIAFFRRMLILARTVGQVDEAALHDRVHTMLTRWLNIALAQDAGVNDEPTLESMEALLTQVAPQDELRPLAPEPLISSGLRLPVAVPVEFDLSMFVDVPTAAL